MMRNPSLHLQTLWDKLAFPMDRYHKDPCWAAALAYYIGLLLQTVCYIRTRHCNYSHNTLRQTWYKFSKQEITPFNYVLGFIFIFAVLVNKTTNDNFKQQDNFVFFFSLNFLESITIHMCKWLEEEKETHRQRQTEGEIERARASVHMLLCLKNVPTQ